MRYYQSNEINKSLVYINLVYSLVIIYQGSCYLTVTDDLQILSIQLVPHFDCLNLAVMASGIPKP